MGDGGLDLGRGSARKVVRCETGDGGGRFMVSESVEEGSEDASALGMNERLPES